MHTETSGGDANTVGGPTEGAILYFLLGFTSLAVQTVLVREALFAFHGGEIGLGLFFAVWLGAIAAGARVGSARIARSGGRGEAGAGGGLALGLALLPWAGLVQVAIFRCHRHLLSVAPGGYLAVSPYVLLLLAAVVPAAFLTGLLFPLGLYSRRLSPGRAYAIESLGSMAGGAFASLYALPRLPVFALLASTGALILAGLLVARALAGGADRARWRPPDRRTRVAQVLLLPLAAGLLSGMAGPVDDALLHARWRGLATGTRPLFFHDTPYHHIALAERQGEVSLYVDGLYQGGINDPYVDSLSAAAVATQHPHPRRLLVVAPGRHGMVGVLAAVRGAQLTLLREDPGIDRALEILGWAAPPEDALQARTGDPRCAMSSASEPADLIAVLAGGPSGGAANRLYTAEFFAACARRIAPGGILVVDLPGTANVASPEAAVMRQAVFAALTRAFRDVRVAPGVTHYFFAAQPREAGASATRDAPPATASPLTWDADSLAARRARLWPSAFPWPAGVFAALFPPERVASLEAELRGAHAPAVAANTDGRPFAYYEQLRRWDRLSGSGLARGLALGRDHPAATSLLLLALFAGAAAILRRRGGQAVGSLASTGLAGMGANLLLLLLFQTHRGTLYLRVGLIVALFMTGLGAGALGGERLGAAAGRIAARDSGPAGGMRRAALCVDLLWAMFLIAWIPLVPRLADLGGAAIETLLLALAFVAGILTALPFPWVAELMHREDGDRDRAVAGGLADAADHAGALCGALVTGTLLVPLAGFSGALLFLAGLKGLSALGWILPAGSRRGLPAPGRAP